MRQHAGRSHRWARPPGAGGQRTGACAQPHRSARGKRARDLRRGADPQLIAREREVGAALSGKTARLLDLAARGSRTAEAETLAAEVRALEAEYDAIDVKLRSASPAWAEMVQPAPLDVAAIQRNLLDSRTTLIEYALGEDAGYVWIVDQNRIRSARLPARAVVEAATRDVYDAVTARGRSVSGETDATRRARIAAADAALPGALAALSTMILTPVLPIAADARLLVVADGALHYLPFGMLPLPGPAASPLITRAEIVNLPSASMLAVQRGLLAGRTRAGNTLAIVADPVFDATDPRVAQSAAAAPLAPEPAGPVAPARAPGARIGARRACRHPPPPRDGRRGARDHRGRWRRGSGGDGV